MKKKNLRSVFEAYDMDKLQNLRVEMEDCKECERKFSCSAFEGIQELKSQSDTVEILCPHRELKRQNIQKGCMHLYRICQEQELPCQRMVWNLDSNGEWEGKCKGIDDYCFEQMARINPSPF